MNVTMNFLGSSYKVSVYNKTKIIKEYSDLF